MAEQTHQRLSGLHAIPHANQHLKTCGVIQDIVLLLSTALHRDHRHAEPLSVNLRHHTRLLGRQLDCWRYGVLKVRAAALSHQHLLKLFHRSPAVQMVGGGRKCLFACRRAAGRQQQIGRQFQRELSHVRRALPFQDINGLQHLHGIAAHSSQRLIHVRQNGGRPHAHAAARADQ